jgi:hypothetical protein
MRCPWPGDSLAADWQDPNQGSPHCKISIRPMTAPGQSRHFDRSPLTSGLPPETDILKAGRHVSKVPTTELTKLFDHLVGAGDERCRQLDAERFRGLQIDDQKEFRRLVEGYIARAGASQDLCDLVGLLA